MTRWMTGGFVALAVALCASGSLAGVMIGAHVGSENDPNYQAEVQALEASIGRQTAIDTGYDDWGAFPDMARLRWDMRTGRLPMQSWRILFDNANPNACATWRDIVSGVYDVQLNRQVNLVKSLGGTVLVRYNFEMTNNPENTCFTEFPVNNNMQLAGTRYILAWRHVVDLFRAAGATNVLWVWCPGADAYVHNTWNLFYPGSNYVDWIGMDDYNIVDVAVRFSTDPGVVQFASQMPALGKPMIIAENAAFNDPSMAPDPQTAWVTDARSFLKTVPQIAAYIYWDSYGANNPPPPPPYDGSGYVLKGHGLGAFRALANDPYFGDMFGEARVKPKPR